MTSLTIRRPWTSPTIGHAALVRQLMLWVDVINVAAAVLRPVVVTVAVITAAATWSPPAHADPSTPITDGLHNIGYSSCATRAPNRPTARVSACCYAETPFLHVAPRNPGRPETTAVRSG